MSENKANERQNEGYQTNNILKTMHKLPTDLHIKNQSICNFNYIRNNNLLKTTENPKFNNKTRYRTEQNPYSCKTKSPKGSTRIEKQ